MTKDFPVFPDMFDQLVVELFTERDDRLEGVRPENDGPVGADECPTLIFLGIWQLVDGVEDLDTGIGVDVQTRVVWTTGNRLKQCMKKRKWLHVRSPNGGNHTRILDLDGDDGVEFANSLLEGDEQNVFVGEDPEVGAVAVARGVLYAHGHAGGESFLGGHEPVLLLCGLVYFVEPGIEEVVV